VRVRSPVERQANERPAQLGFDPTQDFGGIMVDTLRYYLNLLVTKAGKGQGLVEYALIIVLISIVSIVIMTTLGSSVSSVFSSANNALVRTP
jgi:pilus assembly protein Flp/PilA